MVVVVSEVVPVLVADDVAVVDRDVVGVVDVVGLVV